MSEINTTNTSEFYIGDNTSELIEWELLALQLEEVSFEGRVREAYTPYQKDNPYENICEAIVRYSIPETYSDQEAAAELLKGQLEDDSLLLISGYERPYNLDEQLFGLAYRCVGYDPTLATLARKAILDPDLRKTARVVATRQQLGSAAA